MKKKIGILFFAVICSVSLFAEVPGVNTYCATTVLYVTAYSGGDVYYDGGSNVFARGVCWSISSNPTITDSITHDGSGIGSFNSTLTGLTPQTSYYYRAYATNATGTAYGSEFQLTTLVTITTTEAFSITGSSAVAGGNILDNGGAPVTSRGVCWSLTANPTISDSHTNDGPGIDTYASTMIDLTENTTYHYRAFATNSLRTVYGSDMTFTTISNANCPTVSTNLATSVTYNSVTASGNVTSNGGYADIWRGICLSIFNNPTLTSINTIITYDGTGLGQYNSVISDLSPGTTYYYRAYAEYDDGTIYGNEVLFDTSPSSNSPIVTTTPVSFVSDTGATSGGNVSSNGGFAVTSRGICWNTESNPTIWQAHTTDGSGTGSYSSSMTELDPNTTYYVRAYATNSTGTAYGNNETFTTTTSSPVLPTVTTTPATNIAYNGATLGGVVTSEGSAPVTQCGVYVYKDGNSYTYIIGSGLGSFSQTVTNLEPNTTYNYKAYATNSVGIAYGASLSFTTPSDPNLPVVTTTPATNITYNGATLGGVVTSEGSAPVTQCGVYVYKDGNSYTYIIGSGLGNFSQTVTNLESNTAYNYKAYATNSVGTVYGASLSFTTLDTPTVPTITTTTVDSITYNSAVSGGNITSNGGSSVTARGVCYGISSNPDLSGSYTTDGTGIGIYSSSMTGLSPNTPYYARAYGTNSGGTAYGDNVLFTTTGPTVPAVTTSFTYYITPTSASVRCVVTSDGGAPPVTARGVCWSTSPNPDISGSHSSNGSGIGDCACIMTGLIPSTTYYYKAYAVNSVGVGYGEELSLTTLSPTVPLVTTIEIQNVTQNSASASCVVSSDGGAPPIITRGVCWSTSQNPEITNSHTNNGTGTGNFNSEITGLLSGTTYYCRAYATNSIGVGYGNELSFTTLIVPVVPTVATTTASSITYNSAISGGNITDDGGAYITARGVVYDTSPNPVVERFQTSDSTGTGSFTSLLIGLLSNTTYYYRSYATNSVGTSYGAESSFITLSELYEGLIADYPFNGNANDVSGNGNHGIVYGPVLTQDRFGDTNSAYSFNGVQDYISIPNLNSYAVLSFSVWFRFGQNTRRQAIISGDNGGYDRALIVDENNIVWIYNGHTEVNTNLTITIDTWHHAVLQLTSDDIILFLNGTQVYNQGSPATGWDETAWEIGNAVWNHSEYALWGKVDDVKIYDRPLTTEEVNELFGSLASPQNVSVSILGNTVTLNWDAVTGANSYKVYSSDDPELALASWDFEEEVTNTTWDETISDTKRFYYVIASTDSAALRYYPPVRTKKKVIRK